MYSNIRSVREEEGTPLVGVMRRRGWNAVAVLEERDIDGLERTDVQRHRDKTHSGADLALKPDR